MKTLNKERKIAENSNGYIYKITYISSADCYRLTSLIANKC